MLIGVFGVTANPPHLGHLKVIEDALEKCDRVWVSPVFKHPFGKNFINYSDRLEMLKILINQSKKKDLILIKEVDKDFFEKFESVPYSYNLLNFLKEEYKDNKFKLIIGEDNFKPEIWNKFYKNKEIVEDFGVIVSKDFGAHSTEIRDLCEKGEWELVKEKTGISVMEYIKINKLYV